VARVKILSKAGCTNINLIELPQPMTKLEALQFLTEKGITEGDAGYAVSAKLAEKSQLAKRGEVKVSARPDMKAIRARKTDVTAEQLIEAVGESPL
jgi:hypothetical protein